MKTVKSLIGEDFEEKRYHVKIHEAYFKSLAFVKTIGMSLGLMMSVLFLDYALGFYFGSVTIEKGFDN